MKNCGFRLIFGRSILPFLRILYFLLPFEQFRHLGLANHLLYTYLSRVNRQNLINLFGLNASDHTSIYHKNIYQSSEAQRKE